MNEDRESGFVAVSHGDRLSYERVGEGPPVVLLPSDPMTDSRMWDQQMGFLSEFRTVVRYDDRGFGRSSPWSGPHRRFEDALEVLRSLNIETTALVGERDGAGTALEVAVTQRHTVSELVLISPRIPGLLQRARWGSTSMRSVPPQDVVDVMRRGVEKAQSIFPRLDDALSSGDFGPQVEDMLNMIDGLFGDQRSRIRDIWLDNVHNLNPDRLRVLQQEKIMEPPVSELLTEVEARTLVVMSASQEEAFQRAGLELLLEEVPNIEKVVVPRGSFSVALEDPEKLNEVLGEFLRPPHQ